MAKPTPDIVRALGSKAHGELAAVTDAAALEAWRVKYLGRKGALPQLLRQVKALPEHDRKEIGRLANELRTDLEKKYQERQRSSQYQVASSKHDASPLPTTNYQLPATKIQGHLHPLTLTMRDIHTVFLKMGFQIAEGPEVEDPNYNFDLLNIPPHHPARAETDTFYLTGGQVLRTHTSPVQLRSVLENDLKPPFAVVSVGRVFRAEKPDATHETNFHQYEALMVSHDVTIATFKGVVEQFFFEYFGKSLRARLRPSFFPFVEPGFEVDITCIFCEGKGCRVCKQTGWIEMFGAGMVHPNVLRNMHVNPDQYQGFAFGGGVERLAMLRYGINDVRNFTGGDLRFLRQFS